MMNYLTRKAIPSSPEDESDAALKPTPQADIIAKGVATGVAVSTILHTGRGLAGALTRHPVVMFGLGVVAGYFAHKYRKEILSVSRRAAEESRDFLLRQKEHMHDLVVENREEAEIPKNLH
jgi:hypothetical protein